MHRRPSSRIFLPAALALCLAAAGVRTAAAQQPEDRFARQDPAKIMTAEACGECHLSEIEVWKKTPHATGFRTLHRSDAAEAIAAKMGFRLIKRESLCLRCHYTPKVEDGELRAVSGVSCESCHGAGRDWINVHNDYGGAGATSKTESEAHRQQRIERSREAGMRRPSDIYPVLANCYGCHIVAEEKLVNVGGHTPGVAFQLLDRIGDIRHNFLAAQRGGSKTNAEDSPERKRLLYVTGQALDLEYGLRGLAAASENGVYAKAMVRRVRNAVFGLQDVLDRTPLPELQAMVAAVRAAKVTVGQREGLLRTADAVSQGARRFLDGHDGSRLASLDPLVEGTATPVAVAEGGGDEGETLTADGGGGADGQAPGGVAQADGGSGASAAGTAGGQVPSGTVPNTGGESAAGPAGGQVPSGTVLNTPTYAKKTHLRPRPTHATLDALSCSKCHQDQNAWWNNDPHSRSADPFLNGERKNVQLARLYGLTPAESQRGDRLCMDCHGTVTTGQERREVFDGVSCQSCHGPAADYLEPHQAGDKALGTKRPGYAEGLRLGMRELRDLKVRAVNCATCHYVTDPGLLSTGHPSGADFDIVERMKKIKHWSLPPDPAGDLHGAWLAAVGTRGSIPDVVVASLPAGGGAGSGSASGGSAGAAAGPADGGGAANAAGRSSGPAGPAADDRAAAERRAARLARAGRVPRPVDPEWIPEPGEVRDLELPPFPEIDPTSPVEDRLLLLKQRLELLYRAVGGIAGSGGEAGGEDGG